MQAEKKITTKLIPVIIILSLFVPSGSSSAGFCESEGGDQFRATSASSMATLGGLSNSHSSNSGEIDELAQFAVQEHNNKQNAFLEFVRVVKAQEQVVSGKLHHLTVEVVDAGKKKLYEAKVWVKSWMNFKELQEFKHVGDSPSVTTSDLGVKTDGHVPGWQSVAAHDPVVQDAAQHAVKTIQQRSNSLFPYELLEVIDAQSEVVDECANINMVIKVKRGSKEEKFKVEVNKDNEGAFKLNHMAPHAHQD